MTSDPDDPAQRRKPGWLSARPGERLQVRLRRVDGARALFLGVLVSYGDKMGRLRAACAGGCKCNQLLIDGRHRDQTSVVVNVPLSVWGASSDAHPPRERTAVALACEVRVSDACGARGGKSEGRMWARGGQSEGRMWASAVILP